MNEGKIFEKDMSDSAALHPEILWERINDSAQSFGGSTTLRFSPKPKYDYEAYLFPHLYALELKSTKEKSCSFQRKDDKNQAMIKWSQILALEKASSHKGVLSGIIINWRSINLTQFIHIKDFISFMDSTTKKSINQDDVLKIPHIVINQTIKKVHWKYDILKLLSDCIQQYFFEEI